MKEFAMKADEKGHHIFLNITGDYMFTTDDVNKAEKITKALEKQIPIKVTKTGMEFKALDIDTEKVVMYECSPCPSCEKWITKLYKYCPHCGQMIEEV